MRIGLTGAGGVLGRHLRAGLRRNGHEVLPFSGDVRDPVAVRDWVPGLDAVVHAAAVVPTTAVNGRLAEAIAVNVGGTANLAKAVAAVAGCHLTYLSTSHVYAPRLTPLSEDAATIPTSLYGMTKLQGEEWIRFVDVPHLIIRIFSFFDPRQQPPFLVPSLCRRILAAPRGATLDLQGARSERDLIDAAWIAGVCTDLIRKRRSGIVNCGTGKGHSILQIAEMLAQSCGRRDISWRPADEGRGDRVIAATGGLRRMTESLAPPDLAAVLTEYAAICRREVVAG